MGADLQGAVLIGADLSHAELHRANLSRANLSQAIIHKISLFEATYSDLTRWPDGFDPTQARAIREN